LVRENQIIGGGHTQPGDGNPHAEVVALGVARQSNEETRGATAYVTLEPCSHFATTPPCTRDLIEAGIARVVCGVGDPNPAVNGRGFSQLREAGIIVQEAVLPMECRRAQEDFLKSITHHLPFTTLKFAASLDGQIAARSGESQWISGEESRRAAHRLRHQHDAVLVGIGTALADDPQLSVRLEGHWKQPARIVLDSKARLPLNAKLLRDTQSTPLYVAVLPDAPRERVKDLQNKGAHILEVPARENRLDLERLWPLLYENGLCSVLVEGGPQVAGAVLAAGLADKLVAFIAPLILGQGRAALENIGFDKLSDAPRLLEVESQKYGDDIMVSGYLREWW